MEVIPANQHGGLPGRGTKTCWEEIIKTVIETKDIFEFDLKKFFDKVKWLQISRTFDQYQFPQEMKDRVLYSLIRSDLLRKRSKKERMEMERITLKEIWAMITNYRT